MIKVWGDGYASYPYMYGKIILYPRNMYKYYVLVNYTFEVIIIIFLIYSLGLNNQFLKKETEIQL
jgi:hypothetical protein